MPLPQKHRITTMRRVIKTKTHEDWLAARSCGIGSSEIGTILGVNPYETPYRLWRRKTGLDGAKEENEAMLLGHLMEDAVAQRWAIATGRTIIKSSAEEWIYIHPGYDYFRASPDRIYYAKGTSHSESSKCVLECKTTAQDIDPDSLPQTWFCQVQWLMYCTGYKHASLAWLNLTKREFGYKDIEFDKDFCDWMGREADIFWNVYVRGGEEPPYTNIGDIVAKFPYHIAGKTLMASESIEVDDTSMTILQAVKNLKVIKDEIASLELQKNAYEDALKTAMGDAESISTEVGGKMVSIVTWKAAKDTIKFDSKAYQKEHPEACEPYMKSVAGSRRFLIK